MMHSHTTTRATVAMFVSTTSTTTTTTTTRLARVSRETARGVATRRGRSIHSRRSVSVAAKKTDERGDGDESPRGFPLKKGPDGPGRGPGAAPLRMETDEQRRFGYGGDGVPPGGGGGDDDDEEAWDDGWNPGGEGQPSAWGLIILLVVGAWALWEYKRPGGSLNPETKRRAARRRYERAFRAKYGYLPGERPPSPSGGTGSISGLD
tara:strand:+ start:71 stop:691 length:621 start_codon:yes stop_codon:yes gene_type:complete